MTYSLPDAVGGPDRLLALMRSFYDRLYDDAMVGFFFLPHDKDSLVRSQIDYVHAHLGDRQGDYTGRPIREAHEHLPILPGHFDRRHQILRETLADFAVPDHVQADWIALDLAMRPMVLRQGSAVRKKFTSPDE